MRIPLPKVTFDTMQQVTRPVLDMKNMDVNKDKLKEYITEIEQDNPEVIQYIARASRLMELVQHLKMDCSWFVIVSLIILYKSLESQYAKTIAEKN